jgi:hypothetical protein
MGREAVCKCKFAGVMAEVKALLETKEIILRGAVRKTIPFAAMLEVAVEAGKLRFTFEGEPVVLSLGAELAQKWAAAIRNPPSLARKLGINGGTVVRLIGATEDDALEAALAEAGAIAAKDAVLVVACVDTPESLRQALRATRLERLRGVPIWFVYRKGPGHPLNESQVRAAGLAAGLVDTKIASVSATLTAMRFNRRKEQAR